MRLIFSKAIRIGAVFALLLSYSANANNADNSGTAPSLTLLSGSVVQGGMIVGQTEAGNQLFLDDTALALSPDGLFVIGFHRDDNSPQILTITLGDGRMMTSRLVPQKRDYQTQSITGLAGKYVSPPQEVLDRIAADRDNVAAAREAVSARDDFAKNGFEWPVRGTITGVYGSQRILNSKPRAPHYGIDIAAPTGTPVTAPADGIITLADDLYYTGGTLIIDHGLMISSTLLHLETLAVSLGDTVTRGMVIGTVGSTGRSTGPHLDWRISWQQKRLDPELALAIPKERVQENN